MLWLKKKSKPERLVPFCKDCRWIQNDGSKYAVCGHSMAGVSHIRYDLVTGNPADREHFFASIARASYGCCGPEGRLFEPLYFDLQPVHCELNSVPERLENIVMPEKSG